MVHHQAAGVAPAAGEYELAADLVWAILDSGPRPTVEVVDAVTFEFDGKPAYGLATWDTWHIKIAVPSAPLPLDRRPRRPSDTSLAHELCHFWQGLYYREWPDHGHLGQCFDAPGRRGKVNADLLPALRAAGM